MNRGLRNLFALGLVIIGALALAIATFLPLVEPPVAFHTVEDNNLFAHGGWWYVVCAVFIALGGIQAFRRIERAWGFTVVLCVIVAVTLIANFSARKIALAPIGAGGPVDPSEPGVTMAPLGIAVNVAGLGVALALVGSVMLRQTKQSRPEVVGRAASVQAPTRKCPDCAETILADARVCKHCGYRFTPP